MPPPDVEAARAVAALAILGAVWAHGHVWLIAHENEIRTAIRPLDGRVVTLKVGFKGFITTLTGELYVPDGGRVVFLDTGRARYTLRLGDLHGVVEA